MFIELFGQLFSLIITTSLFSKWDDFLKLLKKKRNVLSFITGILIFTNWSTWIYAVVTNKIIDASFGYFIMPILSVFLGILFLKNLTINKKYYLFYLWLFQLIYLLFNFLQFLGSGLIVAFTWSIYSLFEKKISVESDVGLLIESLYITPLALIIFYLITLMEIIIFHLIIQKLHFGYF